MKLLDVAALFNSNSNRARSIDASRKGIQKFANLKISWSETKRGSDEDPLTAERFGFC